MLILYLLASIKHEIGHIAAAAVNGDIVGRSCNQEKKDSRITKRESVRIIQMGVTTVTAFSVILIFPALTEMADTRVETTTPINQSQLVVFSLFSVNFGI